MVSVADLQPYPGRSKDVAGPVELHPYARSDLHRRWSLTRVSERDRPEELEHRVDVRLLIQRQRRPMPRPAVAVGVLGIPLHEVGTVPQHDLDESAGVRSQVDRALEAGLDQPRKVAAVIKMGVRDDDRVDGPGVDGRRIPVPPAELALPLKQA